LAIEGEFVTAYRGEEEGVALLVAAAVIPSAEAGDTGDIILQGID